MLSTVRWWSLAVILRSGGKWPHFSCSLSRQLCEFVSSKRQECSDVKMDCISTWLRCLIQKQQTGQKLCTEFIYTVYWRCSLSLAESIRFVLGCTDLLCTVSTLPAMTNILYAPIHLSLAKQGHVHLKTQWHTVYVEKQQKLLTCFLLKFWLDSGHRWIWLVVVLLALQWLHVACVF